MQQLPDNHSVSIPPRLVEEGASFVRVKARNKAAFEKDWQKNPYTAEGIKPFLEAGENYGILGGVGNLVILDADSSIIEDYAKELLPETFTVKSGGGEKFHHYFRLEKPIKPIALTGKDGKNLGHLKGAGGYVVGPGSVHPDTGRAYDVIKDIPIASITKTTLLACFETFITAGKNPRKEKSPSSDMEKVIAALGLRPIGGELCGPHPVHGSTTGSNFRVNPEKGVWHCFRCGTGGDAVLLVAVLEKILDCSEARPRALRGEKLKETCRIAKEKYGLTLGTVGDKETLPLFPLEALLEPIRSFVEEAAKSFPCPLEYVAVPLLTLLGGAIGFSRVIEIKRGWQETSRLWWGFIGPPGTMKSPPMKVVSQWSFARQRQYTAEYDVASNNYEAAMLEYEIAVSQWKKGKGVDPPPIKPTPPILKRVLVQDTTIEALGLILKCNPRGVTVISDELSGFVLGVGQYKKGGGSDRKQFLSIWAHQDIVVDRISRQNLFVPSPFLSVTGGIQPDTLKDLSPEQGMKDGFIHRFLLVEPEPIPTPFTDIIIPTGLVESVGNIFSRLFDLQPDQDKEGSFSPVVIRPTQEALETWKEWYADHDNEVMKDGFPDIFRGPWAKLRGYSWTFSLILALCKDPETKEVPVEAVLGAIVLVEEYLKPHLRAIYPRMLAREATPDDKCREAIMAVLETRPQTRREIIRTFGKRFSPCLIDKALNDLTTAEEIGTRQRATAREGVMEFYKVDLEQDTGIDT